MVATADWMRGFHCQSVFCCCVCFAHVESVSSSKCGNKIDSQQKQISHKRSSFTRCLKYLIWEKKHNIVCLLGTPFIVKIRCELLFRFVGEEKKIIERISIKKTHFTVWTERFAENELHSLTNKKYPPKVLNIYFYFDNTIEPWQLAHLWCAANMNKVL